MRAAAWMAIAVVVLAGCSPPRSSGVTPLADGSFRLAVASRDLGSAARQALNEAAAHCGSLGRQAQMLRRQINPADYDLIYRCADGAAPLQAGAAPILLAQPMPAGPAALPAVLPTGRASLLPAEPPSLAALTGGPVAPASPPAAAVSSGPIFSEPVFAPVPDVSPRPPAPRSYEALPPVTGTPGGPPQRPLTPLPPIAEPALAGPPPRLGAASATPPPGFWAMRRN
ncbi:hypothetical protein [Belnapia rosea]|uniref:hypothetical protein n=1 Tax=Belnapia rosea TaxID=938405 RepID=UPI00115F92F4|nr:hypothetical protein [Belnapia rosea]